jgi:hypothetical protein
MTDPVYLDGLTRSALACVEVLRQDGARLGEIIRTAQQKMGDEEWKRWMNDTFGEYARQIMSLCDDSQAQSTKAVAGEISRIH